MAEEKKTLSERHMDEVLTDNSKIEYCKQCKDCKYRDGGDAWSNDYQKSYCAIFSYPTSKPIEVINNKADCAYRKKDNA